jgi:hypothetical protein
MTTVVVHGLSIFKDMGGFYKIRATIRSGDVQAGQILSFTTPGGERHSLEVKERREGPGRHITLIIAGDTEAISDFSGGYYLFGD